MSRIREALGLFPSMIVGGEAWTDAAAEAQRLAFNELDAKAAEIAKRDAEIIALRKELAAAHEVVKQLRAERDHFRDQRDAANVRASATRERCARIAEKAYRDGDTPKDMEDYDGYGGFCVAAERIATKIRAASMDTPVREVRMWTVVDPSGRILPFGYLRTQRSVWRFFRRTHRKWMSSEELRRSGYRIIRVIVTYEEESKP